MQSCPGTNGGFCRRRSSEDRGLGSLPFALASPEPANDARSLQRIAIPKPPVCQAYSSMALAVQKWWRQNPPPSRNFFRTEGNIMPSCRKEWIPLRSAACTALQIAQPPSANALAKVLRVNHRPCPGADCFSSSLFRFKGRTRVEIAIGSGPSRLRPQLQKIAYFEEPLPGHDSATRIHPLVRSHQLRPAKWWEQRFR